MQFHTFHVYDDLGTISYYATITVRKGWETIRLFCTTAYPHRWQAVLAAERWIKASEDRRTA
jgi:hypothetical protein